MELKYTPRRCADGLRAIIDTNTALAQALEDLLGNMPDRGFFPDRGSSMICRHCGHRSTKTVSGCSDDCPGHKARTALDKYRNMLKTA